MLIVLSASVFMLSGCAKDGAVGATGKTGNANVIANVYTSLFSDYVFNSGFTGWQHANYPVPSITTLASGVMVYVREGGGQTREALPTQALFVGGDFMAYQYSLGQIQFQYLSPSNSAPSTFSFEVIVIPPAIKAAHPNTNWNNYNEVKQTLNLPD